jgi:hypothetical protein
VKRLAELHRRNEGSRTRGRVGDATVALDADHPLARAERTLAIVRDQAVAVLVLLAVGPVLMVLNPRNGLAIVCCAAVVDAGLWAATRALVGARRNRIHDALLAGSAPPVAVVQAEVQRLLEPAHTAKLADLLERALDEGTRWHDFAVASRPPYGVRNLPPHAAVIHEISSSLRMPTASARGVVLIERLMRGGYGSALYDGTPDSLARELGRIRYEVSHANTPRNL